MEGFFEDLTRGNVTEVKVVLASVVAALACYQVAIMAVGWGTVRVPWLDQWVASDAHRAVGDAIVVVTVVIAAMCISYFEIEDDAAVHATAAIALLAVLALKIAVVRWFHRLNRLLPLLGIAVWALFAVTVATSAGDFLADR